MPTGGQTIIGVNGTSSKPPAMNNNPFRFVYFGDAQEDVKSMCSRIFRAAYKKAPDAAFWLFFVTFLTMGIKMKNGLNCFMHWAGFPG